MDLTIRRATVDDCAAIQRVIADSWRESYRGLLEVSTVERTTDPAGFYPAKRFRQKLDDSDLRFLVALVGGDVAGVVNVCWGSENTHEFVTADGCEIRSLYLAPPLWREGIGTALVEAGRDAFPPGTEESFAEVFSANERGRAFYESVGFHRFDGRTISLYGESLETDLYRRPIRT
ncbi:GNAT family N-acetyltransferase [Natronorubrum halophilum]|uniref:GNAT family N-acetyltransferase n=1 Tax=Natronorubrum halophilum TaxID=1702106 RepID=UPI0010C203F3|nr:GNAT family N-acetyltransferase [Natronorubrum halophilum]